MNDVPQRTLRTFIDFMFTGYLEHLHLKGDRVVFIHAFDPPPMQSAKHSKYHENYGYKLHGLFTCVVFTKCV